MDARDSGGLGRPDARGYAYPIDGRHGDGRDSSAVSDLRTRGGRSDGWHELERAEVPHSPPQTRGFWHASTVTQQPAPVAGPSRRRVVSRENNGTNLLAYGFTRASRGDVYGRESNERMEMDTRRELTEAAPRYEMSEMGSSVGRSDLPPRPRSPQRTYEWDVPEPRTRDLERDYEREREHQMGSYRDPQRPLTHPTSQYYAYASHASHPPSHPQPSYPSRPPPPDLRTHPPQSHQVPRDLWSPSAAAGSRPLPPAALPQVAPPPAGPYWPPSPVREMPSPRASTSPLAPMGTQPDLWQHKYAHDSYDDERRNYAHDPYDDDRRGHYVLPPTQPPAPTFIPFFPTGNIMSSLTEETPAKRKRESVPKKVAAAAAMPLTRAPASSRTPVSSRAPAPSRATAPSRAPAPSRALASSRAPMSRRAQSTSSPETQASPSPRAWTPQSPRAPASPSPRAPASPVKVEPSDIVSDPRALSPLHSPLLTDPTDPPAPPPVTDIPKREPSPQQVPLSAPQTLSASLALSPPASSPLTPVGCTSDTPNPHPAPHPNINKKTEKGKGRVEPERRVLPARIRRAAGAGAETIRELEQMIVDWLERYGDITTPPETLSIRLTTLPFALLEPKPYVVASQQQVKPEKDKSAEDRFEEAEPEENKPEENKPEDKPEAPKSKPEPAAVTKLVPDVQAEVARIETPSWIIVQAGEDDQMEAREELSSARRSPSKRLRHSVVGAQPLEDTSDAYYEAAHRKMVAFERRQRIREVDELKFMRHKMNTRIEMLRNLQNAQWATVVSNVLARADPSNVWERGRKKLEVVGVDWLRRRIIKEGLDLLKRYDQLLPSAHEQKKHRLLDTSHVASSPAVSSVSPPPTRRGTPVEEEQSRKRRAQKNTQSQDPPSRRQSLQTSSVPSKPSSSASGRPKRASTRLTRQVTQRQPTSPSSLSDPESSVHPTSPRSRSQSTSIPSLPAVATPPLPKFRINFSSRSTPTITTVPVEPVESLEPVSVLVQAARRRETGTPTPGPRRAPENTTGASEKTTRSSARLKADANPFGVPFPASVDAQADFSLSDVDEFRPIIAARISSQESHSQESHWPLKPHRVASTGSNDEDEMRDMEGVEASVLNTGSESSEGVL